MKLLGINHTGLVVADLEAAIDFYCETVGLKLVERRERQGDPISQVLGYKETHIVVADVADANGRVIELVHYVSPKARDLPSQERSLLGAGHIAFTVANIDAALSHLKARGAKPMNPPAEVAPGKWVCYLQDPFDNWIEIIQLG